MRRRLAATIFLLASLLLTGCSSGRGDEATRQEKFGVRMARLNLWREAMFRFQRAVELNPTDATAYSNLAVALEANGDFDGAAKAYREALRLDKSNQFIQKNYSRFVEFTTRDRRRQQRRQTAQTTAAAAGPVATSAETPPAAEPVAPASEGATPEPAEAADPERGDPPPTAAAPVVTPAPNPAPPEPEPPQPAPPTPQSSTNPGGLS